VKAALSLRKSFRSLKVTSTGKRESKQALDGRHVTPLAKFMSHPVAGADDKLSKKEREKAKKEKANPFKTLKSMMEEAQGTPLPGLQLARLTALGAYGHQSKQPIFPMKNKVPALPGRIRLSSAFSSISLVSSSTYVL